MSLRPCFSDCETLQIFALLFGEIIFKEVIIIFCFFFYFQTEQFGTKFWDPVPAGHFSVRSEIDLVASTK